MMSKNLIVLITIVCLQLENVGASATLSSSSSSSTAFQSFFNFMPKQKNQQQIKLENQLLDTINSNSKRLDNSVEINSIVEQLEQSNWGIAEPAISSQVKGRWRLLHTNNAETASPIQRKAVDASKYNIYQDIVLRSDTDTDTDTDNDNDPSYKPTDDVPEVDIKDLIMYVMKDVKNEESKPKTENGYKFMKKLLERKQNKNTLTLIDFENMGAKKQKILLSKLDLVNSVNTQQSLLERILLSELPIQNIHDIIQKQDSSRNESEANKYGQWLEGLLRVPFGKFIKVEHEKSESFFSTDNLNSFFEKSRSILDDVVFGHDEAKDMLIKYIAQITRMNKNGIKKTKGLVIGIQGPCGNGKTTLIEKGLSKVLKLPFATIPLGGASDSAFLHGHSYTYEGSTWGQIADVLMKTKCMNPIIYMDELDKVSQTHKGQEIINQLIHLTDPSQNTHFQDRYFGNIDIDLSHVTWVFSYNDSSNINHILKDRITEIKTSGFTTKEKIEITSRYLIPSICQDIGINQITVEKNIVQHIIDHYTYEGGVRKLKELLLDIFRNINKEDLCGKININGKRRRGSKFQLTFNYVQEQLKKKYKLQKELIHKKPLVGIINGLYASSCVDIGGILPIEIRLTPSDSTYSVCITGNLGQVMKESASVAKTLAWKFVSEFKKKHWFEKWKTNKESVHVHCPEGAVSKDGPSAGTALTVAILSMLTDNKIKNDIAITGEINLSGDILPIGGLRSKLYGAKKSGCKLVLYPSRNGDDMKKIISEYPDLITGDFRVQPIEQITDVFQYVFVSIENIIIT